MNLHGALPLYQCVCVCIHTQSADGVLKTENLMKYIKRTLIELSALQRNRRNFGVFFCASYTNGAEIREKQNLKQRIRKLYTEKKK